MLISYIERKRKIEREEKERERERDRMMKGDRQALSKKLYTELKTLSRDARF